jgi:hypothetical protein
MAHDRLRLRLVDDAAPEKVAVVGAERVDPVAVRVEGEREVLILLNPEVAVEAALQLGRLLLELFGESRILPDLPCEPGSAHFGVVGVALQLTGCTGKAR